MDNQADTTVPGQVTSLVASAALVTLQPPRDPHWTLIFNNIQLNVSLHFLKSFIQARHSPLKQEHPYYL